MANTYRVDVTYQRVVTFYVEAEDSQEVEGYMDAHPDWNPGDTPGLIDLVGDENEVDYTVAAESKIQANFRVTGDLDLEEIDR